MSDLARVLAEYWVEQMLATFELRAARPPRLWPGRLAEARRLASAYCEVVEDCETLAATMQEMAELAWPVRAANVSGPSSHPPLVARTTPKPPLVELDLEEGLSGDPQPYRYRDDRNVRDSMGEIEVDLGEL